MRKNSALVVKIANTRLTKIFMGLFALAERLPTSDFRSLVGVGGLNDTSKTGGVQLV